MRNILPEVVFDAVAAYLRRCGRHVHRDWSVNQAHEGSLTGAAFAEFQTHRSRTVQCHGQEWTWKVTTRKFGSGGPESEERLTGADGIIEVQVQHVLTGHVERKGLLVQAKKRWLGRNGTLQSQVGDMEGLAPGCSAAIDYAPNGYTGVDGKAVLIAQGDRRRVDASADLPLGDFLADRFLECKVGLRGLYYESNRHLLHLPAVGGRPDAIKLPVNRRMRIEIDEVRGA